MKTVRTNFLASRMPERMSSEKGVWSDGRSCSGGVESDAVLRAVSSLAVPWFSEACSLVWWLLSEAWLELAGEERGYSGGSELLLRAGEGGERAIGLKVGDLSLIARVSRRLSEKDGTGKRIGEIRVGE